MALIPYTETIKNHPTLPNHHECPRVNGSKPTSSYSKIPLLRTARVINTTTTRYQGKYHGYFSVTITINLGLELDPGEDWSGSSPLSPHSIGQANARRQQMGQDQDDQGIH